MKATGIILIIAGILMMIFTGFNFKTQKKVIDIGELEINKTENNRVGWPTYAGGVVLLVGSIITIVGFKKK